jgi:hypothetical protein
MVGWQRAKKNPHVQAEQVYRTRFSRISFAPAS